MFATKRLGKELAKIQSSLPPGITLVQAEDFKEWQLDIRVLDPNPLYVNKIFRLVFIFSSNYPIEPPEVTFLNVPPTTTANSSRNPIDLTADGPAQVAPSQIPPDTGARPIPIHPHIYTNGIICLDLLGSAGWSPVQSVESVCMSIQSMLTGNSKNERPEGDADFVRSMGPRGRYGWSEKRGSGGWAYGNGARGLRDVRFVYDDNTV